MSVIPPEQTPTKSPMPTPSNNNNSKNKSKKTLTIVLSFFSSLLALIAIGCLIWYLKKKFECDCNCCIKDVSLSEIEVTPVEKKPRGPLDATVERPTKSEIFLLDKIMPAHFEEVENWDEPFDIV